MPRRKRRDAALCVQRKGYWRTKKIIVTEDNEGNRKKLKGLKILITLMMIMKLLLVEKMMKQKQFQLTIQMKKM